MKNLEPITVFRTNRDRYSEIYRDFLSFFRSRYKNEMCSYHEQNKCVNFNGVERFINDRTEKICQMMIRG